MELRLNPNHYIPHFILAMSIPGDADVLTRVRARTREVLDLDD